MNEIVKYDNRMNKIALAGMTAHDQNLLMALCSKLRDQEENEIVIGFDELRDLIGYKSRDAVRFKTDLLRMNAKLMSITCCIADPDTIEMFSLFTDMRINLKKKTLAVSVHPRYRFLLNQLSGNFTRFELSEFSKIGHTSSKTLYRLLKQYRSSGKFYIRQEELKRLFCVNAEIETKKFNAKMLYPAIEEVSTFFKDLEMEKVKNGKIVTAYIFRFTPEEKPAEEYVPSEVKEKKQEETQEEEKEKAPRKGGGKRYAPKINAFNCFPQHEYDFDELERELIG